VRLTTRSVPELPEGVRRPSYDRRALRQGVLHFGVGNFHRSHQALYFDELIGSTASTDWGIRGVGILPSDRAIHAALTEQDGLYSLVEKSDDDRSVRVIGSLVRHVFAPANPETVFEALGSPETRLVTLTITEGGYCTQGGTKLDFEHPDIEHDLRRRWRPKTVYGYLAEGLDRRRLRGLGAVPVLSCDNVPDNGLVLGRGLVEFCSARCADLGAWLEDFGCFPSSMVDRITPAATASDSERLAADTGIQDACPVVCEPFRQWVMEDCFGGARPPLDAVGVHFTPDVRPYQEIKIRLLNATHSAMGYLGYLCGYRYVHEVASAAEFGPYLRGLMDDEVSPLLSSLPGLSLEAYKATLVTRFRNGALVDPLLRICAEGSAKIPKFVLPSIRGELEREGPIRWLALCVASFLRFLEGRDDDGDPIPVLDGGAGALVHVVRSHPGDARRALGVREVFGELGRSKRLVNEVTVWLRALHLRGARAVLANE
jgi:mannitol 2-dehydrogenase